MRKKKKQRREYLEKELDIFQSIIKKKKKRSYNTEV